MTGSGDGEVETKVVGVSGGGGSLDPTGLYTKIKRKGEKNRKKREGKDRATEIGPFWVSISLTRRWGPAAQPWPGLKTIEWVQEGVGFAFSGSFG